jgi:hypothetical protein
LDDGRAGRLAALTERPLWITTFTINIYLGPTEMSLNQAQMKEDTE